MVEQSFVDQERCVINYLKSHGLQFHRLYSKGMTRDEAIVALHNDPAYQERCVINYLESHGLEFSRLYTRGMTREAAIVALHNDLAYQERYA
jgi:Holliday junction resolvase